MFMPKSDRFTKDKTDMLNSYREMNKDLAEEYEVPYIDMRQAFLDAIPSYRLNYKVQYSTCLFCSIILILICSNDLNIIMLSLQYINLSHVLSLSYFEMILTTLYVTRLSLYCMTALRHVRW